MKKVKIIYVVFLFALSFLWHYVYNLIPSFLTSIFFPVNESIWEHMKIIYGVFIFGAFFEYFLLNKFKVIYHNFLVEVFLKAFLGVLFYLMIYIPIYNIFGENIVFSIALLLITFIVMELFGTKILNMEDVNLKVMPIILIILGFVLFGLLTYYPRHNFLFFDSNKMVYGIPKR